VPEDLEVEKARVLVPLEAGRSYLTLLSHSGSRGVGNKIATRYSKIAEDRRSGLEGEAKKLAWLELSSEGGSSAAASSKTSGSESPSSSGSEFSARTSWPAPIARHPLRFVGLECRPNPRHVRLDVRIVHHTGAFCVSVATAKINLDSRLIIPSENTKEGFRDRTTAVFTIATSRYKQGG
jgi:hypothetical protein